MINTILWLLHSNCFAKTTLDMGSQRNCCPKATFHVPLCACVLLVTPVVTCSNTCKKLLVAQRSVVASMLLSSNFLKSWWLDFSQVSNGPKHVSKKVSAKSPVVSKRFQSSCKQTSGKLQTGSWFQLVSTRFQASRGPRKTNDFSA